MRPPYLLAEAIFCVGRPGHVTWWVERYDSGVRSIGQLVIRLVFALVKWNFHYRFFNQGVFKAGLLALNNGMSEQRCFFMPI